MHIVVVLLATTTDPLRINTREARLLWPVWKETLTLSGQLPFPQIKQETWRQQLSSLHPRRKILPVTVPNLGV